MGYPPTAKRGGLALTDLVAHLGPPQLASPFQAQSVVTGLHQLQAYARSPRRR